MNVSRFDFANWCRLLSVVTGAMHFAIWLFAMLGVYLWGPRLLLWAFLAMALWLCFIAGPLALLAWAVSRDSWEGRSM